MYRVIEVGEPKRNQVEKRGYVLDKRKSYVKYKKEVTVKWTGEWKH